MMKKIWLRIMALSLLLISGFASTLAQTGAGQPLFLMWDERGKYGYIDASGRVVVKPQFDDARPFTEGVAAVSTGKTWGFIDTSGKTVVPLTYFYALSFSDGLAAVTLSSDTGSHPCGYIDHAGQFVIKPQNKFDCKPFKEGFAVVGVYNENVGESLDGYLNKKGEIAIGGNYALAEPFSEGLARVNDWGDDFFVNADGATAINLKGYAGTDTFSKEYEPTGPFSEGLALVGITVPGSSGYSRFGFVNKKGKVVIELPERMRGEGNFYQGRALVQEEKTEKVRVDLGDETITMEVNVSGYGYVNNTGKIVIRTQYSEGEDFSEDLAAVRTGQPKPSDERDLTGSAAESAFSGDDDGSWICINRLGSVVIKKCGEPLSYEELALNFYMYGEHFGTGFVDGLYFSKTYVGGQSRATQKPVYGYMDKTGKYVWIQPHGAGVVMPRDWREKPN